MRFFGGSLHEGRIDWVKKIPRKKLPFQNININMLKFYAFLILNKTCVSSMIHVARPTIPPVAITILAWSLFCFARFWKICTDVRTKKVITTGRGCGSATWIIIAVKMVKDYRFFFEGSFLARKLVHSLLAPSILSLNYLNNDSSLDF